MGSNTNADDSTCVKKVVKKVRLSLTEMMKRDRLKPSDKELAWIRRLQREYYCTMCENDEHMLKQLYGNDWKSHDRIIICHCTSWDYSQPMYRFWLCNSTKPIILNSWNKIFRCGR